VFENIFHAIKETAAYLSIASKIAKAVYLTVMFPERVSAQPACQFDAPNPSMQRFDVNLTKIFVLFN
jgi:hypothetical protein